MNQIRKYLPLLIIIILSASIWFLQLNKYFSFGILKAYQESINLFITTNLLLSVLTYSTIYIIVVGLSIPGATFMTLTGGFFFGQWIGTFAVVLSATFGASIFFLSAKMASSDLLSKKIGNLTKRMQEGFTENAFFYLLTLRFIPLFPFVVVNIAAALLQVPMRTFFIGTFLGIIPGSFVYVSMGVALRQVSQKSDFSPKIILDPQILLALIGLGILSLLPVLYKRIKNHHF